MKKLISVLLIAILLLEAAAPLLAFATDDGFETPMQDIFELNEKNCTITLSQERLPYTGKAIKPEIQLFYIGAETPLALQEYTDYSLSLKNNTAIGVATFTITGEMPFYGTLTGQFTITPAKMPLCKKEGATYNTIQVRIPKQSGVSGYQLSIAPSGTQDFTTCFTDGNKPYTFKQLTDKRNYKIKVRAYAETDSGRIYGAYSDYLTVKTAAAVGTPKIAGYSQLNSLPMVTWSKVKSASKYTVYRSTSKDGTYTKIGSTKNLQYSDKSAKVHKTYYYQVRANIVKSGKTYSSYLSNKVKIKAMKTVFVGDAVMNDVKTRHGYDAATYVTKSGIGTRTFYNSNNFKLGNKSVSGVKKLISTQPDRIFIMLGMNDIVFKSNAGVLEYYGYILEDVKAACPNAQIVILPVSPTKANSARGVPKKKRIDSFNKDLKKLAKKYNCYYYDYTPAFVDSKGYLLNKCDGGSGYRWNTYSAKLFITQIKKFIIKH